MRKDRDKIITELEKFISEFGSTFEEELKDGAIGAPEFIIIMNKILAEEPRLTYQKL